ncbi:hypothetical protein CCUG63695_01455 [Mycobacteroides franklinii]|uniref:Uncharacterized protein n=1 Tax=Mycobacteroides franklinii TaxID=948102 RepID=A0A4R8QZQ9_9MYCO|nr:hypothetical protein CCUG64054_00455 [Mycobacteroides franklinii]TDZ48140.1 hypothetical protein CCUG63697_04439 [Mycobacteroides franklinii]TDZ60349.1 hypothetical protein CCUG63696_00458 [Mycobacteroides franklinii]TDZ65748.1 hypothetical protein CCUG63695_01455 [Mycobacteroides franklinii]TDZ73917.1 hypothetical protein CCUG64056_00455 [Mycobacteroides franklinii]
MRPSASYVWGVRASGVRAERLVGAVAGHVKTVAAAVAAARGGVVADPAAAVDCRVAGVEVGDADG